MHSSGPVSQEGFLGAKNRSVKAECPCGGYRSGAKSVSGNKRPLPAVTYSECCGQFIDEHVLPPTAEQLMRSRYTAYALSKSDYLLSTWHTSTRPRTLDIDSHLKWLGLTVRRVEQGAAADDKAVVEFVARYKVGGQKAERLQETSDFVKEGGRWFYVTGLVNQV
ncbi:MAG: YchJ family protein [Arenicella sp.]